MHPRTLDTWIGSYDRRVYCLHRSTLTALGSFNCDGSVCAAATFFEPCDGAIIVAGDIVLGDVAFVAATSGSVYALVQRPAVAGLVASVPRDGTERPCGAGTVVALWTHRLPSACFAAPQPLLLSATVAVVLCSCTDGAVYALDAANGMCARLPFRRVAVRRCSPDRCATATAV